jgi:hypothetical protein
VNAYIRRPFGGIQNGMADGGSWGLAVTLIVSQQIGHYNRVRISG